MSLGSIGSNSASEFFETIIYQTAYTEAQGQIRDMSKDIQSSIVKDALESSMTVLSAGLIFMLIRKQEDFIEKIFAVAQSMVVLLLGSQYAQKIAGKIGNLKGLKLFKKLSLFRSSYADRVATAGLVVSHTGNHMHASASSKQTSSVVGDITGVKEHVVNKEKLNLAVGGTMAQRYNETLMFKLFTKSFSPNDEMMIKKMVGKDAGAVLKAEDLNKVADFMFVTDSEGNITGLTEQLFSLINGLGYVHHNTKG
ncbi:MAG: hypothetical protein Q7S59_05880 [Sulfurimonas sp.]|nr:hypothetical protein [Sulfurimonas sp.]